MLAAVQYRTQEGTEPVMNVNDDLAQGWRLMMSHGSVSQSDKNSLFSQAFGDCIFLGGFDGMPETLIRREEQAGRRRTGNTKKRQARSVTTRRGEVMADSEESYTMVAS